MVKSSNLLAAVLSPWIAASTFPIPPFQTPGQKAVLEYWRPIAAKASEEATEEVIELFNSKKFRDTISGCCSELLAYDGRKLLELLQDEFRAAEYSHGFRVLPTDPWQPTGLFDPELGEEYGFLMNQYQANMTANKSGPIQNPQVLRGMPPLPPNENPTFLAEENIFKLPHFRDASNPTWAEAASRMVYVAQNLRRLSYSTHPAFGEGVLVLDNDFVKDAMLAAPTDSGWWEISCNHTWLNNFSLDQNCPAWKPQVLGTWDHFNHILLKNLKLWQLPIKKNSTKRHSIEEVAETLFRRSPLIQGYPRVHNATAADIWQYWETNIVGNIPFPKGVRFVIGSFSELFGTVHGRRLQKFAKTFGWPMVWAFTDFAHDAFEQKKGPFSTETTFNLTGRFLDPSSFVAEVVNASYPAHSLSNFEKLWEVAVRERIAGGGNISEGGLTKLWRKAYESQLKMAPATATRCGGLAHIAHRCVGYTLPDEMCVCARSSEDSPKTIIV